MELIDWIKLTLIFPAFFVFGPVLGFAVRKHESAQKWMFAAMCAMTVNGLFGPGNWGLTLDSVETYRGHAKGYHFYFNHILAIALIVAAWFSRSSSRRYLPPGFLPYLFCILCCFVSIVSASRIDYVLMASHKMLFFSLIYLATFCWCRNPERMQFFLMVMAVTMSWQAALVLKMKYLDGIYQVRGTFEHQNPLAMYAILIGMPLLSVALGPFFKGRWLCMLGFLACAIIIQSALSRAALALFAAGTVAVVLVSLVEKPTQRRLGLVIGMALVGAVGLVFTLDTIVARFHDDGNAASAELRDVLNEAARSMARDHYLGAGWNNYALVVNAPYPYAEHIYDWIRDRGMKVREDKPNAPVESHYYLLLGENGYLGLVSWLLVIVLALARNIRDFVRFPHSFESVLALGIAAGCSLNYFQSTLERVLTQPRNLMLWLILYGITARLSTLSTSSVNHESSQGSPEDLSEPAPDLGMLQTTPRSSALQAPVGPMPIVPNENRQWPVPAWLKSQR